MKLNNHTLRHKIYSENTEKENVLMNTRFSACFRFHVKESLADFVSETFFSTVTDPVKT